MISASSVVVKSMYATLLASWISTELPTLSVIETVIFCTSMSPTALEVSIFSTLLASSLRSWKANASVDSILADPARISRP